MALREPAVPQEPRDAPPPGKKWSKVTKVENGIDREEWILVDDKGDEPQWPERSELRVLNRDLVRVDGPDKVSGRARYTADVRLPGMVYARLLCCPYPHAQVTLDVEPAKKVPGVVAARVLKDGETKFLGQPVAAVAADTPEHAEDGLRAIVAKFEKLPWAVNAEQALAENAAQVTAKGNIREDRTRGNADEAKTALAGCEFTIEATYTVPVHHHASLETHGVVVDYRGGEEATVYASTQGTFSIPEDATEPLGLKSGQVTSIVEHMGGGFGSKFGLGIEGKTACELARELKRPVHLMLTRADEFLMAGNRSGAIVKVSAGANREGKLLAISAEISRLGGIGNGSNAGLPYVYKVASDTGAYSTTRSVFTHTDSSRAMRAPGHPQASFAMESTIDELAYLAGIDPLSFRKINLSDPKTGVVDATYARQLDLVAQAIGWGAHPNKTSFAKEANPRGTKTGIGFAVGTWGGGGRPECKVEVRIQRDGGVTATVGSQDLGTGTRTYVAAIVAEEFGLPPEAVVARIGNSTYGRANGSGGSTTTASLAPAVKDAAHKARLALFQHLASALRAEPAQLRAREGEIFVEGNASRRLSWRDACATLGVQGLSQTGEWKASLAGNGVHGAQAAKVEVDLLTGAVRVLEMVGVQDMGLPLNRLAARSQLNGGMIQALSYGLFEQRVIDPDLGLALNANFEDYKLAGCQEMPEMIAMIDDADTRGVIGMAEPAIIPGHSAIANAIYNACGVRIRNLPLTADKVLLGLEALGRDGGAK
jgi:xanthine dehydrogenase YagR molybdenum-binding subunit